MAAEKIQKTRAKPVLRGNRLGKKFQNDWHSHNNMTSGKVKLTCTELDLSRLVASVCKELEGFAKERGLNLVYESFPARPYIIAGDANLLKKAIGNLIRNSLVLSQNNLVVVKLSWSSRMQKVPGIKLSITCHCESVPMADYVALFMKHKDSEQVINLTEYDTLLSFSTANEFVKLHGGSVDIVSQYDVMESKYVVFLPHDAF